MREQAGLGLNRQAARGGMLPQLVLRSFITTVAPEETTGDKILLHAMLGNESIRSIYVTHRAVK